MMNKSLENVLKALEQDALAFCSESDWAIVVAECERAGNVRRVSKSAQVILEKAMSRSEAGRYAAQQRWKNHELSDSGSNASAIDAEITAQAQDAGIHFGPLKEKHQDDDPFSDETFNDLVSGKTKPIATGFAEVAKGIDASFAKIVEAESDPHEVKRALKVKNRLIKNLHQGSRDAQKALEGLVSESDPRKAMKNLRAAGARLHIVARQARLKQFERYQKPEDSVTIRAALNLEAQITDRLENIIDQQVYGVGKRLGTFSGGNGTFLVGGVRNPDGWD